MPCAPLEWGPCAAGQRDAGAFYLRLRIEDIEGQVHGDKGMHLNSKLRAATQQPS